MALGLPPGSAAQEPRGLARRALDEPGFPWASRDTAGFRVHVLPGTWAARHRDSLTARLVEGREHDLEILGTTGHGGILDVFFLEDRTQMERLVGVDATGFAERATGSVFLVTNAGWRPFERHEIMHVLAWRLWGEPAEPAAWIQEGLAQFADGACGGYAIDDLVVALAGGRYVPLDTLTGRFRQLDDLTAYLQAASFVGYLYRAWGRAVVRNVWERGLAPAAAALHRTPAALQADWERRLPPPEAGPPDAEVEAIRVGGCGISPTPP